MRVFLYAVSILLFSAMAFADDTRLETIGVLGGQNLYLTYSGLGLLYQNYQAQSADPDFSIKFAKNFISSCRKSKTSIQKLIDGQLLTGEDAVLGKNLADCYEQLITEANAFIGLVENRNSETEKQFQLFKNKAWIKIQSILNIDE
jgi:hypothetical protein